MSITYGKPEDLVNSFAEYAEAWELAEIDEKSLKIVRIFMGEAALKLMSIYMANLRREYRCRDVQRWAMRHKLGIANVDDAKRFLGSHLHAHELDQIPMVAVLEAVEFVIDHFDRPDIPRARFAQLLRGYFWAHLQPELTVEPEAIPATPEPDRLGLQAHVPARPVPAKAPPSPAEDTPAPTLRLRRYSIA